MQYTLRQKWRRLLNIGRNENHSYLEIQRIALLNAIAFTTIAMSIIVTIIYMILGFQRYVALLIIPMSLIILLLNKNNKSNISKDVAFFGFLALIIVWSFFTRRTNAILLLMVLCNGSAFLYLHKLTVYIRIFICGIVYIIYMYYDSTTVFIPNPNINYPAINIILTLLTCGLLLFYIMLSVDLIKYTSGKLLSKIEELKVLNEKEKNTQFELEKSHKELMVFNSMLDTIVKNSTEELQSYQKAIDDNLLSVVTDLEGRILKINESYLTLSKYNQEELIGKNFNILNSNHHSDEYYEEIRKTVFSGNLWRGETKNKAKDGTFFWITSSILPVFNPEGEIVKFFTVSANVTDKKNAEEEQKIAFDNLLKSNNRLNLVLENQSDLIVITNKIGMRKYVNLAFCEFFGKSQDYFIGTNYKTLNPEDVSQSYLRLVDTINIDNPKISFLEVLENAKGEKRWIIWNEMALFNAENEITEIFSFGHDITELKQVEFQSANYIAQFEEMAFKTSHLFRGPLSNIIGLMTLLEEDAIKEDEIKQVGVFMKSAVNKLDLASKDLVLFIDKYNTDKKNDENKNFTIDFTLAKTKHLKWKYKIRNFLDGSGSLTTQQAISHLDCDLGKWYYNEGKLKYGHLISMQNFEIEHEKLHKLVREILDLKTVNKIEESELKYLELINRSDKIIMLLDESEIIINKNQMA